MGKAYDFSIVPGPAPAVIVQAGGEGILGYSFASRQSDEYLDRCRALGLKVVWVWERNTDSIFYADGAAECRAHEARCKPGELTYVACDTNDGGVAGRDLTPFLRAWQATTREEEFGLYGSSGAIRQGKAFGGKLKKFWGVVNWINGGYSNNDPRNIQYWQDQGVHLIQMIGSDIPNTDLNMTLKEDWGYISTSEPTPAPRLPGAHEMILISEDGGGFFRFPKNALFLNYGDVCVRVGEGQSFEEVVHNWGALPRCPVPQAWIDAEIFRILNKDALLKKAAGV